jgi:hypothetical protein
LLAKTPHKQYCAALSTKSVDTVWEVVAGIYLAHLPFVAAKSLLIEAYDQAQHILLMMQRPKIIDAPLTLILMMWQVACRYDFGS